MPGISFGRHERKMGFRGAPNTPFDNVRIPAENLVGEEGKAFRTSMRALDLNRPTIGAESVGLAQGALDACIAYAKERKQFNKSIAEFQGVQFMLADMAMQIEAAAHSSTNVPEPVMLAIGLDLGPNLSVTGSLATLLWLVALRREKIEVGAWTFLKLGLLVTSPALIAALTSTVW
jgi:alkylation response protein AidB-like acyl-CoA dehydrogenase